MSDLEKNALVTDRYFPTDQEIIESFGPETKSLAGEGSWRGPFSGMGENGGWFTLGSVEDGWQRNLDIGLNDISKFGPAATGVTILSQELSRIKVFHWLIRADGGREKITNKAPHRVFRRPNHYQTLVDFLLFMMRALLYDGNAYAVAVRNDRGEVESLYPLNPRSCWPYIVDGDVFYRVGDQDTQDLAELESDQWYPQRDILHIRMHCPKHPLIGESPFTSALYPAAAGMQINRHTAAFFKNMSRPSGVLRYPGKLGATAPLQEAAIKRIKERFMQITQSQHTGEPLVLQENATWAPMTMSAVDSELIKSYNLSERQILQILRIPPFLAGDLDKSSFQNVESLSRFFISSSLGWYVTHFEEAFARFFNIGIDEEISFDVETALLRGDLESRMSAYAKGIQSGVLAPNEARKREKLGPQEYGDESRVQQQLVPLSYGVNLQPPTNTPAAPPEPEPEPTEEENQAAAFVARRAIEKAMRTAA